MHTLRGLLGALLMLGSLLALPAAASTPPYLQPYLGEGKLLGTGKLTFWGFHVYDARLWATPQGLGSVDAPSQPFALQLTYARSLKGADIAKRSLEEMRKLDRAPEALQTDWLNWMNSSFPDVKAGDTLTGVYLPGQGMRLYFNGKPRAQTADTAFAQAFFAIWLDARSTAPDLRRALVGAQG